MYPVGDITTPTMLKYIHLHYSYNIWLHQKLLSNIAQDEFVNRSVNYTQSGGDIYISYKIVYSAMT